MDEPTKKLIAESVSKLKLKDIVLNSSNFDWEEGINLLDDDSEMFLQNKREVDYSVFVEHAHNDKDETRNKLSIFVDLGVRVVGQDTNKVNQTVLTIEAGFVAQYTFIDEIEDQAILAFANFNGVHNVWPFWRQHVFDIVSRAKLPTIEIPLFAGLD